MTKSNAIMSLIVDSRNNVDVRFEGSQVLRLSMLGALDFGKDWLLKQISVTNSVSDNKQVFAKNNQSAYHKNEEVVSKSSALSHYIEMRDILQKRMQVIAKSDPKSQFRIDPSFKEKL